MHAIKIELLVDLLFSWIILCTGMTEFRCTNKNSSETQIVSLKCPQGLVIDVKEALYGRNRWGDCQYLVGDCTELFNVDTQCCGRSDCSLAIRKIYSIKCMAYVTFFRIIYECENPEKASCDIANELNSDPDNLKTQSIVLPPTAPDRILPISFSEDESKDLYIIIGSAVTVAFLLMAIITVIFLLRKFQWQGEKQCVQELFIVLCKRHPPDGCETPSLSSPIKNDSIVNSHDIQPVATIDTTRKNPGVYSGLPVNKNSCRNSSTKTVLKEIIEEVVNNSSFHESKTDNVIHVRWADNDLNQESNSDQPDQILNGNGTGHMFTDV